MKGVSLRRQQRHSSQPSATQGCDAPVSLVFRTHNEGLSKAAFLFCPKNFNLANPSAASAAGSGGAAAASAAGGGGGKPSGAASSAMSTSSSSAAATRPGVSSSSNSGIGAMHDGLASAAAGPAARRFAASTSPATAAPLMGTASVRTLVEAIIELRPFFPATNVPHSGATGAGSLPVPSPATPLTASHSSSDQSPPLHSLLTRPGSAGSLPYGSIPDLTAMGSFASPTLGGGHIGNGSFTFSTAGAAAAAVGSSGGAAGGRRGEWGYPSGSPRSAGPSSAIGSAFPSTASLANLAAATAAAAAGGAGGGGGGAGTSPSPVAAVAGSGGVAPGLAAAAFFPGTLMHPSGGWICRAMAFNDKEVSHANGAISVSQSLTSKCPLINELAKGKVMARILTSYADVQERYGLSHLELTVDNQYVSRSDLFLISEALRERILYEGEEMHVCNFRLRVREMLQTTAPSSSPAIPITGGGGAASSSNAPAASGGGSSVPSSANAAAAGGPYVRVGCGIVLPSTRINFQSLSPVHYLVIELAREMWETTIDGRIALTWAIRKFVSELLLRQLPRRKASPLIRVVFTGRLHREYQFGRHSDVFHLLELPREARNVDVVEEIRMHCDALVERVLREVQSTAYQQLEAEVAAYREGRLGGSSSAHLFGCGGGGGDAAAWPEHGAAEGSSNQFFAAATTPTRDGPELDAVFEAYVRDQQATIDAITAKHLFVHAKQSNTLEALSILLERCNHHYIDRHLTLCGHAVTIVSAGKGFYQVNNSLVQIVCARLHDMGLEKVHVVCIGRPPLHVTPLLEYTSDDETLRSQYHLHSRALSSVGRAAAESAEVERYYESPEWMSVFFFHSALHNNGGETVFELLPKECWQRQHPLMPALQATWPSLRGTEETGAACGPAFASSLSAHGGAAAAAMGGGGESAVAEAAGGEDSGWMRRAATDAAADGAAGREAAEAVGHLPAMRAAAVNAPLLIPGLGLRSYPVADVTLPVRSASVGPLLVGQDGDPCCSDEGAGVALRGRTPPPQPQTGGAADLWELSPAASGAADRVASPTSPKGHLMPFSARRGGAGAGGGGRLSPLCSTGMAASTPLLVRTTTASSSVFASPNIPGRGSMPRGGGGGWRDPNHRGHHHGLYSSHNVSQVQMAHHASAAMVAGGASWGSYSRHLLLRQPSQNRGIDSPNTAQQPQQQQQQQRPRVGLSGSLTGALPISSRLTTYASSASIAHSIHVPSFGAGSRHSHPNSLLSCSTSSRFPPQQLAVSRSVDNKSGHHGLGGHSLAALDHSVRSAGSSLHRQGSRQSGIHQLPGQHAGAVLEPAAAGATLSSSSAAAAARAGLAGVYGGHVGPSHLEGGGAPASVVVEPVIVCAWYCLHAAKQQQHPEGGAGLTSTTAVGIAGHGGSGAAAGGGGGGRQAGGAAVQLGGSAPATAHWSHTLRGRQGGEQPFSQAAAETPLTLSAAVLSVPAKPWHKALSCTRADAVYCGCNVVDSDLRNGYLILEITIDAEALPTCFWSPRVLLDDKGWAELMGSFTGRDDRLTVDADLEAYSESSEGGEETGEGEAAMMGSRNDSIATVGGGTGGGSGNSAEDIAAGAALGTPASRVGPSQVPAATQGSSGVARHSTNSVTGSVYRFQSDFRPSEVFCRSHSGISRDGRTLIIPTHNNSVSFQSSEQILLRLQPRLFVSAPDEGGDEALQHHGPLSPVSSHHAVDLEDDAAPTNNERERQPRRAGSDDGDAAALSEAQGSATSASGRFASAPADGAEGGSGAGGGTPSAEEKGRAPSSRRGSQPVALQTPAAAAAAAAAAGATTAKSTAAAATEKGRRGVSRAAAGTPSPLPAASTPTEVAEGAAEAGKEGGSAVPSRRDSGQMTAQPSPAASGRAAAAATGSTTNTTATAATASAVARPMPLQLPPTCGVTPSEQHDSPPHPADGASQPHPSQAGYGPRRHSPLALLAATTVPVGFVQLRNSLLFAIKPINPLRPTADDELREDATALTQSAESASTATVLRRRWQWRHPDIAAEPPHLASWSRLCTCRLLPLYGSKPAYPREGFYTVSPHQYTVTNPAATGGHADPADERKRLLEFVLQRLQQQYQIVVDAAGLAAGAQWPRADPSPNARLEMSLGHQTHTLKVGETAKTISVTRMLHRGMYSNGQVTHMLSYRYLLWNYLADDFAPREVHMEAQVGERNAFRWESLDRWLQERPGAYIPRGPDLWLRSREVAVMLLPEDPANPPPYEEFLRFIGYRFSVHLSTHGKAEWTRNGSGVSFDISEVTPASGFPEAPPLMDVVLVHDNPLSLDTRNVMDRVTGRTLAFDVPVEERLMSVDVSLPQKYEPRCCYFLKVSWLVCAASLVVDWFGSFIANASRFHFHAVPMCCYYSSPKAESLTAHYDVEAATQEEEPALRRTLAEILMAPPYGYYPDTPQVNRNCRLVHLSGLCCVILPPSPTTVAQWYQNACLRQGSVEQLELLEQFKEAEALARRRVHGGRSEG